MSWVVIGIGLVVIGMVLIMVGSVTGKNSNIRTGGVIMLGPIPIVFGSDNQMALGAVILAIIILIGIYLFAFRPI